MAGHTITNLSAYTRAGLLCLLLVLFRTNNARSQTAGGMPVIISDTPAADIATTGIMQDISAGAWVYFSDTKYIPKESLTKIPFAIKGTKKFEHFIVPAQVNHKAVLKFTLTNSSQQEQSVYFCPGFYYDSIQLFTISDGSLNREGAALPAESRAGPRSAENVQAENIRAEPVPPVLPDESDSLGYRKITLAPHQQSTYLVVLSFIKTATNSINPSLTRDNYIKQGIILNHRNRTSIDIITNLFAGIMLMMIFYALSQYLQNTKPEFLYYAGYAACISSLLFLKSILHNTTIPFNFFFESYLDNIIFCVGHIFYIVFHRRFLETKKNYPDLDRFLRIGSIVIGALTVLYSIFFFLSPDFRIANYLEDATKVLLLVILLIFILKGFGYRNRIMNYIVMGNLSLFLLSILSQVIISTNFKVVKTVSVLNLALFYYEVGITIEVLFFLFALSYKNKMELTLSIQKEEKLKLETERKELEKQVAVLAAKQDERNRISTDMHDELGSGVTAIRLMSEIVKSKMKEQTLPEIEKISHSANELINKMNTIIWTMTSSNDSVENLIAYIRSYAVEFFENTAIDCYFSMPASIPPIEISGEKRRNIFLSVKESLTNVLKHSQSTVVRINVTISDRLVIEIQDDGVGINMEKLRKFGNGLNNMKKRMASIEGEFNIENHEGTLTTFYLKL